MERTKDWKVLRALGRASPSVISYEYVHFVGSSNRNAAQAHGMCGVRCTVVRTDIGQIVCVGRPLYTSNADKFQVGFRFHFIFDFYSRSLRLTDNVLVYFRYNLLISLSSWCDVVVIIYLFLFAASDRKWILLLFIWKYFGNTRNDISAQGVIVVFSLITISLFRLNGLDFQVS